ncbi:Hypothetical protein R9X50_00088700 [Acrodontium crateriforme]|uniref:Aminoglycoside phosphotransferase domain-containing protein n=1 Tax=Acrodontium crateriforme TaxID=150365 RepID=A0AAQ3LYZ4_9PEZI|nr:Hypothetical protein R9X50_00088700 [Acrodontium crateriforme]
MPCRACCLKVSMNDAAGLTLFHPDFHTRNILVEPEDPTVITGIIDWQSAAIEPAFLFDAETPDFAEELPDEEHLNEDRAAVKKQRTAEARLRSNANDSRHPGNETGGSGTA